jgi:hypothetical protein
MQEGDIIKEKLFIFFAIGMIYFTLEGIFRFWTHGFMIIIGGLCGVSIDTLYDVKKIYKLKMWQFCILGILAIWLIEYSSGYILNHFNYHLWEYKGFGNIDGYISIPFGLLIFMPILPFASWLIGYLKFKFLGKGEMYKWWKNYLELFKGK